MIPIVEEDLEKFVREKEVKEMFVMINRQLMDLVSIVKRMEETNEDFQIILNNLVGPKRSDQ